MKYLRSETDTKHDHVYEEKLQGANKFDYTSRMKRSFFSCCTDEDVVLKLVSSFARMKKGPNIPFTFVRKDLRVVCRRSCYDLD